MRIAVVYHLPNPGGITRFTHALIDGLLASGGEIAVDYYVSERLLREDRVPRFADGAAVRSIAILDPDVIDSPIDEPGVATVGRTSPVHWVSGRLASHRLLHTAVRALYLVARAATWRIIGRHPGKPWYKFTLPRDVVAALGTYDVVYFPFPYYIQPTAIGAPVVATFHDLNHKYFRANFGRAIRGALERQLRFWTGRADAAVVSTRFVESDLLRYYPGAAGRTSVVYVAPYSIAPMSEATRLEALARFGLRDAEFLLYPSNHSHHKNLVGLVKAADLMKRWDGHLPFPIVFTGFGTDGLGTGKWPAFAALDEFLASSSLDLGVDVRGLGFVSDEEVDALTRSARIVVSTSLYEAGCGPALDAWKFGVPVAFSNIPPFVEQLEALGVEARMFDPRDPEDIARVLEQALSDREGSLAMAERSRKAIAGYGWERAAQGYLRIFSEAIEHHRAKGARR